ncbi:MAG: ATP-binding protein [Gammaproteobacteria bacterium]|nr:ATP-binding protein [Gammaproteobacteria bacterium]MBU1624307.1 ATP-binding protein [Gammaproteobacteria bacterium]MBU1981035.1 ATP-binding protein [Gammaproteobacteria bacterium]
MDKLDRFLSRADGLLSRLEGILPSAKLLVPDWQVAVAFRWNHQQRILHPVPNFQRIALSDLLGIDDQKQRIRQNTQQFVQGGTANNVLLSGARGTGKSSLVKALLSEYAAQGLRVIQIDKQGLIDLSHIIGLVQGRKERFILYCDDLSFNAEEPGYQSLKAALDGDLVAFSENLLIYATSNRRHLMPDYMQDNLATKYAGDEVHPAESVEEKVSLSERFGLWVSFYPFSQDEYLAAAAHWLKHHGWMQGMTDTVRTAALQWSLMRGSRSGRVAGQFARDWCGQHVQG